MAFLVKTIPIVVLQQSDASLRRLAGGRTVGIVCVFSHVHQAIFINDRRYRVQHQRFVRHEFNRKSIHDLQAPEGFSRFFRRDRFQRFFQRVSFQLVIRYSPSHQRDHPLETQERNQRN